MGEYESIYYRADVYDSFYVARGKDYRAESHLVLQECEELISEPESLLDVGCGTGRHLLEFSKVVHHVEGVDVEPRMLAVASDQLEGVPLHEGDIRSFRLARSFDIVVCMFSTVGYLPQQADLERAIANCADHLSPGGVLVVEPWWSPSTFLPGHVAAETVSDSGRKISRSSHTVRKGDYSEMTVHYLVANSQSGIEHFSDTHLMSLFSTEQYVSAFKSAGLHCSVRPTALGSRSPGLLIGKASS